MLCRAVTYVEYVPLFALYRTVRTTLLNVVGDTYVLQYDGRSDGVTNGSTKEYCCVCGARQRSAYRYKDKRNGHERNIPRLMMRMKRSISWHGDRRTHFQWTIVP